MSASPLPMVMSASALWDMVPAIHGLLIGDKGYLCASLHQDLQAVVIKLETTLRSNMHDARTPAGVKLLMRMRRLIETVIGQLAERCSIEQGWARDMWHLTSRLNRQMLAHTGLTQER